MKPLTSLRSVTSSLFQRSQIDTAMEDELRSHIQHRADDLERSGVPRIEAVRRAQIEFGGYERFKEECRTELGGLWMNNLLNDLRFGLRMFRKSAIFTAVVVITLALGIGANTAIFSVVQSVVLAPLPFDQPDRLVIVWENNPRLKRVVFASYPNFQDWQRNARSFQQMVAFTWQNYDLTSPGTPEHINGKEISSEFFSTLGTKLALGREFSPVEDEPGGAPVAIISDRLWRDRFSRSSQVLGKSVMLRGVDYTIVGVLPADFHFWTTADVYTPLGQGDPLIFNDRAIHSVTCIGRLKPDVSIGQAQGEMGTVQENLDHIYPTADGGLGTKVVPLKQVIVGDISGTLFLLLGAVGIVLLITCANVANLLLARSRAREQEIAIRSALGATRSRIIRQLVTESVLLSLAGGASGLVLAKWGLKAVLATVPGTMPRSENIGVNVSVLLFALGISITVGILFGLAPALKSSRIDVQGALKEGSRGSTGVHHRAQSSLVIIQVALTLVLLVGAGLLFRTIRHFWNTDPGFDAQHVLTFKVGLSPSLTKTPSSMRTAYRQLLERISNIPGVQSVDLTTLVPLSQYNNSVPFWIGSHEPTSMAQAPRALMYETGPDYLRVMGIPLLRGRFISQADATNSPQVVVIDTNLARTYFGDKDPVGQTITFARVGEYRIIGVVGHVMHWGLGESSEYAQSETYTPFFQIPDQWMPVMHLSTTVVLRTPLVASNIIPAVKNAVYGTGRDQPVFELRGMHEIASDSMSSQRFPMILLATFASLALVLASVGIYGVISYSTAQRAQEIGVRMALGAGRLNVFRMVVGQGLRLVIVGLAIGAVAAFILVHFLSGFSHLLYGVKASDPSTFIVVSLLLSCVALLACYIPARRAMLTDPVNALRHE
jgi:predicted permease